MRSLSRSVRLKPMGFLVSVRKKLESLESLMIL